MNSTQRALPAVKQTERKREKGRQAQYRHTQNRTAESRGRVPPKPIRRGVPAQRSRHQESASALPTPSYPHPTPHTALSSPVQFSCVLVRGPCLFFFCSFPVLFLLRLFFFLLRLFFFLSFSVFPKYRESKETPFVCTTFILVKVRKSKEK